MVRAAHTVHALCFPKLVAMFGFADIATSGVLAAKESLILTENLAKRLSMNCNAAAVEMLGDTTDKDGWLELARTMVNESQYTGGVDPVEKIIGALKRTIVTKEELSIYRGDFDKIDTNGNGYLSPDEVGAMLKLQLERDPTEVETKAFIQSFDRNSDGMVSWDEYMDKLCGAGWEVTGLSDEEAMEGFLKEMEQVPRDAQLAGLAKGEYKDKPDDLAKLTDEEIVAAWKAQSLETWAAMADDADVQAQQLDDVMQQLSKAGNSEEAAQLKALIAEGS